MRGNSCDGGDGGDDVDGCDLSCLRLRTRVVDVSSDVFDTMVRANSSLTGAAGEGHTTGGWWWHGYGVRSACGYCNQLPI